MKHQDRVRNWFEYNAGLKQRGSLIGWVAEEVFDRWLVVACQNGEQEAQLIALCCFAPPKGQAHWSLRSLTQELKTRGIATEISHETVRNRLI